VRAVVEGHRILTGTAVAADQIGTLAEEGKTPVCVAVDGVCIGLFGVADRLKPTSVRAVAALHELGLKTVMLTGAHQRTAAAVRWCSPGERGLKLWERRECLWKRLCSESTA
jgi:P-type E1-E2 ATPase